MTLSVPADQTGKVAEKRPPLHRGYTLTYRGYQALLAADASRLRIDGIVWVPFVDVPWRADIMDVTL